MRALRLKYTKIQNQNIYITKTKLKCTRYVIRTQLVQLASWRKWGPMCAYPREQINKILLTQNGVGVSLGTAGLQLFPQQSCGYCHNPLLETVLSTLYPNSELQDKMWKNPALPLRDSLPQNIVVRGLGPSVWSHA